MKNIFKIFGIIIALIVVIALGAFLFINMSDIPSYDVASIEHHVEVTPEKTERGKKLATLLCANCHFSKATGKLTGRELTDVPSDFGQIFSTNITQDQTHGIANYTDGELLRLLRTGVKRNGQYAPPYMAKLPLMADSDVDAIISFLHSDDPWVSADATPSGICKPSFLSKFLCRVEFKPFDMPAAPIALPDTSNKLEFGKYLALNLDCYSCHSADFKTNDYLNPEKSVGFFGGGNILLDEHGKVLLTQNITSDKEAGIGGWTEEQFIKAVKYGLKDGEPALRYPMVPYSQFTDKEVAAIYAYLQTVPAISINIDRSSFE